jgi:hypothetical protein
VGHLPDGSRNGFGDVALISNAESAIETKHVPKWDVRGMKQVKEQAEYRCHDKTSKDLATTPHHNTSPQHLAWSLYYIATR